MKLKNFALSAVAASVLMWGGATQAATYNFGTKLSGDGPVFADVATLDITDNLDGSWTFDLSVSNLDAIFGDNTAGGVEPFIRFMSIAGGKPFDPPPPPTTSAVISGIAGDVDTVAIANGGGPSGGPGDNFDYRYNLGDSGNRLLSNESVTWTVSDYTGISLPSDGQIALHIQGMTDGGSGWYISPVPEPETYAMLLAGLGLIGFSLRRQKQ